MWTRPRATLRAILDSDPRSGVHLLAMAAGVISGLNQASLLSSGDELDLGTILIKNAFAGPVYGIVYLYLFAFLFRVIARGLGGRGTFVEVRAASAWSTVIFIWMGLLWVPSLLLLSNEMFTTDTPRLEASVALSVVFTVIGVAKMAGTLWGFVVLFKCLGEAHRFSAWRALVVVLGSVAVFLCVFFLIGLGFATIGT